jgi:hypothetical protein
MLLDLQMSLFKLTMRNNVALAMGLHYIINPMTQLSRLLSFLQVIARLIVRIFECGKNCNGPTDWFY